MQSNYGWPMKTEGMKTALFLSLLQKVLPKATQDTRLASTIYEEVEKEVQLHASLESFGKFCEKGGLENLEPETVDELLSQLAGSFGEDNVTITPNEEGDAVAVEITLPDRTITNELKVRPTALEKDQKMPFVSFPVALPDDPELVWLLARRENFGPDEAARALANIEEEFWATAKGQKLLKERVEKSFAEFISNVPASALAESGLKRYNKDPETLKILRLLPKTDGRTPVL